MFTIFNYTCIIIISLCLYMNCINPLLKSKKQFSFMSNFRSYLPYLFPIFIIFPICSSSISTSHFLLLDVPIVYNYTALSWSIHVLELWCVWKNDLVGKENPQRYCFLILLLFFFIKFLKHVGIFLNTSRKVKIFFFSYIFFSSYIRVNFFLNWCVSTLADISIVHTVVVHNQFNYHFFYHFYSSLALLSFNVPRVHASVI